MIKTIFDSNFKISSDDFEFNYQKSLTNKLDSDIVNFDQNKLNEIVLWKVNRYAQFDDKLIKSTPQIQRVKPINNKGYLM